MRPEVRNDKVNVEDLEKRMVEAIGIEADRCRQSVENIVKHAIFEILHVPDYLPNNDSITSIQIFTLGSSSATYEALSQLVKHFITQSRWRPGLAHEKSIEGLKITIAENRPLHEGVILASKLNELIDVYQAPRPAPPKLNSLKQASSIGSLNKLLESKDWYLNAQHQKFLESLEDHHVPLTGLFSHAPAIGQDGDDKGHLGDLLECVDSNGRQASRTGQSEKIKVNIELTSDVGLGSCLLNAGRAGVLLLLAAHRVLPNGDALCKLGSTWAAYTAHKLGQQVIILCGTTWHDRLQPAHEPIARPVPSSSSSSHAHPMLVSGMIASWKSIFKPDIIDHLANTVRVHPGTSYTIDDDNDGQLGFDVVKAEWISCFISDSGKMGLDRVKQVSHTLAVVHNLLWEDNDDNNHYTL